ncbi:MAG: GspE/PulE family protein [Verrucomicrobiota bacterium]
MAQEQTVEQVSGAGSSATIVPHFDLAPLPQLVRSIIFEACAERASDIHFDALSNGVRLRYRVDGILREKRTLSKELQSAVAGHLKIMANLDVAEKRLPQEGRAEFTTPERIQLDLRVACMPTLHGESMVIRILDRESPLLNIERLGCIEPHLSLLKKNLQASCGMILITGPTGSGKTTTLYSCLQSLNQPQQKIITVEDPVENRLSRINQVQVNSSAGVTFASTIRAMLRQSPDIIMVGEIRDAETAAVAMNAAFTGHLVLSTLHTNDAPSAVTRLIDMDVKPLLLSSALRLVIAQRLARKICPHCAEPYRPTRAEKKTFRLNASSHFQQSAGCTYCHGGYKGRTGIFEMMPMDETLHALLAQNFTLAQLRLHARKAGMRTLREDGFLKASRGITTIKEVLAATLDE